MELFFQSESFIVALIASGSALFGVLVSQGIGFWKLKSEHKYERQIFLRQKYEDLVFRLIDFSMILKSLDLNAQQQEIMQVNINEFIEKGGQIEVITVLYFPKLVDECKRFLEVAHQLFVSQYDRHHNLINNNADNLDLLKIKFDERYDELYSEIQKYKSDYT
ncbi:hypothetical protein [Psychrobacter sp. ANT_WB68]|uniref:hypothetical protein n=1 Tax=Psychrobacter sp. ANT_WB68 TaxID=2597355 RepID=UPI0011F38FEB|nr:hypothetical protein [Psychrobacter sp. ANT_WB68]KAA0913744.1 hypothetical protein FQ084_10715 [Psychrobacter sp. ANT_WB68]